jgi:hypothetical protein
MVMQTNSNTYRAAIAVDGGGAAFGVHSVAALGAGHEALLVMRSREHQQLALGLASDGRGSAARSHRKKKNKLKYN